MYFGKKIYSHLSSFFSCYLAGLAVILTAASNTFLYHMVHHYQSITTLLLKILNTYTFNIISTYNYEQYVIINYWSRAISIPIYSILLPFIVYIIINNKFIPSDKHKGKKLCIILAPIIMTSLTILFYFKSLLLPLVPAMITTYFVCLGWWVQSTNTTENSKTSHTINMILNSRTSPAIIDCMKSYEKLIPNGYYLDEEVSEK